MRFQGLPVVSGHGSGPAWVAAEAGAIGSSPPPGSAVVARSFPLPARSSDAQALSLFAGIVVEEELRPRDVGLCPIPVVSGLDTDLFRPGEAIRIDGTEGAVYVQDLTEVNVVTSFLQDPEGRILLLKRSEKVGTYRGRWAGVSGFLEAPEPVEQAYTEIREETGIGREGLRLAAGRRRPVYARDGARVFVVHPFRFRVRDPSLRLDWEHTEARWIDPAEIGEYPTVPKLDKVWRAVAPPSGDAERERKNG